MRRDLHRLRVAGLGAVFLGAALVATGCSWFTAFVEQPKLDPWEVVRNIQTPSRGQPQYSVPITGMFVAGYQVSNTALPAAVDSMSAIQNPTPADSVSLANGRKLFQINCAPCHGVAGLGNGPVTKYGVIGINLTADHAKSVADGYIFGMIRNGRGAMPSYNRIEQMERWDVVNYIRGLQGKLAAPVLTGPVGYPGQTGDALPGYSLTAPTRPVPYYRGSATVLDSTQVIRAQTPGPAKPAPAKPAPTAEGQQR
jgi:mono/diheme cytochrome c family protein